MEAQTKAQAQALAQMQMQAQAQQAQSLARREEMARAAKRRAAASWLRLFMVAGEFGGECM